MGINTEFSSNRHLGVFKEPEVLTRHPDLSFEDGNLAIVSGTYYFLVHCKVLGHHSQELTKRIQSLSSDSADLIEGRIALSLEDSPEELSYFLRVLYGLYFHLDNREFRVIAALLRLSTKYAVEFLRKEVLRVLALSWPSSLPLWEIREKNATGPDGVYAPRSSLPHPILLIELAKEVNAAELLPSAFYDLSRYLPSQLAVGYTATQDDVFHHLELDDLLKVLRGKEHAARFFSTFIVNELEGRAPSQWCLNRNDLHPSAKRACQLAFEAITFELIRDVNGMVFNRNSDPLFAIADSFLMQTREDVPGIDNRAIYRACESCRMEYGAIVDAMREDFWRRLPEWFELDVKNWG